LTNFHYGYKNKNCNRGGGLGASNTIKGPVKYKVRVSKFIYKYTRINIFDILNNS
jgi:hypothetical protein